MVEIPETGSGGPAGQPDTVGGIAELYLGNILYALELAALSLEQQGQPDNATFYRGIARELAAAHGRAKTNADNPVEKPR
jgi:hypothetical protein